MLCCVSGVRAGAERNAALLRERAGTVVCVPKGSVGRASRRNNFTFPELGELGLL